jgi:hypothetical protein
MVVSLYSIDLDRGIDFLNKSIRSNISNGTAHDSKRHAEQGHVAKVESRLEQSIHFRFEEEVIERVKVHVESRRGPS